MKNIIVIFACLLLVSCNNDQNLPDPYEAGWKGKQVCEILQDNDELRVLKCTFAPGVGHERHQHQPHFGYTLQGSTFNITDASGTRTIDVNTGVSFSNDQVTEHEVINVGDSTAVFLIIEYK